MQQSRITFPLWAKITTVSVVIALTILLIRAVGGLLNPFIWAVITAYLFNPLVRALSSRTRLGRGGWVILIYLAAGFLIYLGFNWLAPRLGNQYSDLVSSLPAFTEAIEAWIEANGRIALTNSIVFDLRVLEEEIVTLIGELGRELPATIPELVFGVFERLVLVLVYLVVTFYLLVQADQIADNVYGLIPMPQQLEIRGLGRSIDHVLGAYIRSQLLLIAIMAFLTYIPLTILGVRYALFLAIATGFLEIIPFVGPWTAAGSAALVALFGGSSTFAWPSWVLALVVIAIYTVLRQAEDHLIIPNLVGRIVKLHPVVVIFAILAGAALGGALGLLMAVPIAATVKIILSYLYSKLVDSPAPFSVVRAEGEELLDRPAAHPASTADQNEEGADGSSRKLSGPADGRSSG